MSYENELLEFAAMQGTKLVRWVMWGHEKKSGKMDAQDFEEGTLKEETNVTTLFKIVQVLFLFV